MIPDSGSARNDRLSGWRLRQAAEAGGFPVTSAQLERYASWGILGEPIEGRWPREAVDRLIEIRRLESEVRSLPRRVLRLRADFLRFPIGAEHVQRALVAVAPGVANTRHKVARVEVALAVLGSGLASSPSRGLRAHIIPTPPQTRWPGLLMAAKPELVDARVSGWYAWVNWVLPAYRDRGAPDLTDIPIEERVLILAVRDLDADRRLRAWHRSRTK